MCHMVAPSVYRINMVDDKPGCAASVIASRVSLERFASTMLDLGDTLPFSSPAFTVNST